MAGYIIKVTMENTHPPVWRRLIIPEKILFLDLHEILQIAFGWYDSHLHDFSFPNERLRIVQSEEDLSWGYDGVLEKDVLVDDFLQEYNWIRYTYDFGDDWEHKVVFEKEDPQYKDRFAQVIKYKGDNFSEDSGGVYGQVWAEEEGEEINLEDYRNSFDLDYTNQKLRERVFPVRRRKNKNAAERTRKTHQKQMKELANQIEKLIRNIKKNPDMPSLKETMETTSFQLPSKPEAIDKEQSAWNIFCEEKQQYEEVPTKKKSRGNPEYEQLTLPFVDVEKEKTVNYGIFMKNRDVSMKTQLGKFGKLHLMDYCRFLQAEDESGKTPAQVYFETVTEHPEYLLLVFTEEEMETLWILQTRPEGWIDPEPEMLDSTVSKGLGTGLLTCEVRSTRRENKAILSFTKEGKTILTELRGYSYKKRYRQIRKLDEELGWILTYYGMIDIDSWYEICIKSAAFDGSLTEFRRYVYWHLRMMGFIQTGTNLAAGISYASMAELDLERVSTMIEKYARDLPTKQLTGIELKKWKEGYGEFYPCWRHMWEYFSQQMEDEDQIESLLQGLLLDVMNGETVDEICGDILEMFPADTITENVILWKPVYNAVHLTALPGLKGHSREEYQKLTGKEGPPAFGSNVIKKKKINQFTHLYQMEADIQRQVNDWIEEGTEESARKLERLAKECGDNEEMLHTLGSLYAGMEMYDDALRIYDMLMRGHPGDKTDLESSVSFIQSLKKEMNTPSDRMDFWYDEPEEKIVPFRREAKKIMPNDPCPCGSGKKYKKCCGRNTK